MFIKVQLIFSPVLKGPSPHQNRFFEGSFMGGYIYDILFTILYTICCIGRNVFFLEKSSFSKFSSPFCADISSEYIEFPLKLYSFSKICTRLYSQLISWIVSINFSLGLMMRVDLLWQCWGGLALYLGKSSRTLWGGAFICEWGLYFEGCGFL